MSLREKMENAKEVDMFPELSQDEKIEAIVEGKVQIALIKELEKIKAEIGKEFVDLQDGSEEWRSYVNESVLSCYEIVDKHIAELKGENNETDN